LLSAIPEHFKRRFPAAVTITAMQENEKPLVLDGETKQHLDKMLDTIDNLLSGPLGEFLKHRISYFDKLIILNGGTLALSFSAAATFYARAAASKTHFQSNSLLTAWQLLMFSIVAALVSNWLTMSANQKSYTLAATRLIRLRMLASLAYIRDAVPNISVDMTPAIETKEIAAKELTHSRVAKWADNVALFLGFLSQLATVASYFYLYKFAGANILAL
jgi:hypothetical protein